MYIIGLFKHLFGTRKVLPKKPRYERMTTLIAAVIGGWMMIRENILALFEIGKDREFLLLRHLLDELVPLVFFFYSTIHRGSLYHLWQNSMIRLSIVFIIQQHHHYNKAMLSTISDWLHYETVLPEWTPTFSRYLNVLSEKKVEIFHSLLRMQCPSWASAQQIAEFAHVLSAKKFDTAFAANFLAPPAKMPAKQNVSHLAGKSAEYLVAKFVDIFQNSTSGEMTESKKRKFFKLGVLGCTLDQRSFPLGFSTSKIPSDDLLCDLETCSSQSDTAILLSCGHSFHQECLAATTSCVFCERFLQEKVKELGQSFSKSLSAQPATSTIEQPDDQAQHEVDDDGEEDREEADDYYTTGEFLSHLRTEIESVPAAAAKKFASATQRDRYLDHNYI